MAITTQMRTEVSQLYVALFGRAPDGEGLGFWVSLRDQGRSLADIANIMYATTPARTYYPSFLTNQEIVASFYSNVLGRAADASGLAFWTAKLNAAGATPGTVIAEMINIVSNYVALGGTDAAGVTSSQLFNNRVTVAQYYGEKNGTVAGATTVLSTVTSASASVTAAIASIDAGTVGGVNQGLNLTMTSGVDSVIGGNGNDTITADNTGTNKQITAADSVSGGAGTDTLKVFLATGDTALTLPTLNSIEVLYVNGGAVTALTAPTGTTVLSIDSPVVNTAATYTVNGQDVVLANHVVTANTTTTVTQAATATATSQKVTLNNQSRTAANVNTLDIGGNKIVTLNLEATGANSTVSLTNTGTAITALNFTGDKNLTLTENAATAAAILTVDASKATGALSLDTSAATVGGAFKFTGGAGNDTVKFADNALAALVSGAQLNGGEGTGDKIAILDTALTATETARINQAVGFEVLGLNDAITLDASTLTSIKQFSIDGATKTTVINSMATGSTTTITGATNTLTLGSNVGVTDTNVVIGSATSAGITVTSLTTTGITNVSLTSNGTAANTVTTLVNSDNSVFTLKGAADLTLALANGTAVGSKIDGSAATGKLTLTGSNITTSGDIIIGGTGADTLNGGKGADTLTGGAGADIFSFTGNAGTNSSGGTFGQADVITDFATGTDKLQFTGVTDVVSTQQGAVQAAVTALAAGSSDTAIATAMATANTTNLGVSFAVFNGNTYVLFETSGAGTGVAADDIFIKLVGVTTLPTFAADVIA